MLLESEQEEKPFKAHVPKALPPQDHSSFVGPWKEAMERGLIGGRPYSKTTVKDYVEFYVKPFFTRHSALSLEAAKAELKEIAPKRCSSREHCYKALLCFSRYLIKEGALDPGFETALKELRPKRHIPPKRRTVTEEELGKLLSACKGPLETLLVTLLAATGLRASEACSLRVGDVDLERGVLTVQRGKGNKSRRVGLSKGVIEAIENYLESRKGIKAESCMLLNRIGKQMDRQGLFQRLQRIGESAGVTVSPHALRRAFVTINHGKGRPLVHLQIATGHSDIKTTRNYCLTKEQEVVEMMRGW